MSTPPPPPPPRPPTQLTPPPLNQAPINSGNSGKKKGCRGCLGILVLVFIGSLFLGKIGIKEKQQKFERDREKIMADMQQSATAGNHKKVVEIGEPYERVGDYDFHKLFDASKKAIANDKAHERQLEAATTEAKKTSDLIATGEVFTLGGFNYVITSARRTAYIGSSDLDSALVDTLIQNIEKKTGATRASDGASFIVVRYKIKNEGTEAAVVSTSDYKVVDSKGRNFTPSSDATAELVANQDADFLLSELQPGISKDGVQAFQLPNDAFDGKLILIVPEKGLFSSGEKRVKLGL